MSFFNTEKTAVDKRTPVGVGLRHGHYQQALETPADLDFIEVHSENFFAKGGALPALLREVSELYPVSLHGTSLGLGSAAGISEQHLNSLHQLANKVSPVMVSDHAAFAWGELGNQLHHGGDLLPVAFNEQSLQTMTDNINRVQEKLQRQILVENLSAYLEPKGSTLTETEFLTELAKRTDCRLLVDINNLAVNAINTGSADISGEIAQWIYSMPSNIVGEIHLAGCTTVPAGEIMVDDHSQMVSDIVWDAYEKALKHFGSTPTLIEWDTDLPEWFVLIGEAEKARTIAARVFQSKEENL
ncbi:DUF692 domain-containing protein [Endozoicomonas sp. OPT23]|uniref:DUF692 domain-containing protein n=1 Tax=Endozoicomonas sp. OPT23 TaxID=2072845 RepID=UPI00129AFA4D|nr:DUF692 domain-containing protein [Endozoicomonas sp. OPT23]MRI33122.1 DUF692 domain-containing protein [Endozoicomonas sp. OPT23]